MNTAIKTNTVDHSTDAAPIAKQSLLHKLKTFPALLALCIQACALLMVASCAWASYQLSIVLFDLYIVLPVLFMVGLQSIIASQLARKVKMDNWWQWIHGVFPIATWLMMQFDLPNELYLIGFVVTLSMFWTTFRTQVPYYPSRLNVWKKISTITHQYQSKYTNQVRIIDIGSGLGGFSMYLSKMHKDAIVEGIEVAPLPWLSSRLFAAFKHSQAHFKLGDYQKLDFAKYDIIFAYLSPAAMTSLWEKSQQEMGKGCLLISLEFEVPDIKPTKRLAGGEVSPDIYVYEF